MTAVHDKALELSRLRDGDEHSPCAFNAADLRGASLRGLRLTRVSLRGACLDEADLSGARFTHVDLAGATLRNAILERSWMQFVDATKVSLIGAKCADSSWEQVDLSGADLSAANMREAMIRSCVLERCKFDGADLELARLVYSQCADSSFVGTSFRDANTVGSYFRGADFTDASQFLLCREILVELLQREIRGDFERAQLVGAVAVGSDWCYAQWKAILGLRPHYRDVAMDILRKYPDSGALEALRAGVIGRTQTTSAG